MAKLEEFSGGYYRAEMTVQPLDRGPSIERGLYDLINREIYYKTDAPVTMRLGLNADAPTFEPSAENGMPTDVLGVPTDLLDMAGIHPSAESVSVFIYKPEAAYLFQDMSFSNSRKEDADLQEEDEQFFNLGDT
jgi:hypothetical protein